MACRPSKRSSDRRHKVNECGWEDTQIAAGDRCGEAKGVRLQPNETSHRYKAEYVAIHHGQGRWEHLKYLRILPWKGVSSRSVAESKYTSRKPYESKDDSLRARRSQRCVWTLTLCFSQSSLFNEKGQRERGSKPRPKRSCRQQQNSKKSQQSQRNICVQVLLCVNTSCL